ncbi:MAG: hypothetical protein II972_00525, partial [Elusimicrobiaceae bacterium]|nr:hypothetical protein [Elusimicrobiaceae bacterium]
IQRKERFFVLRGKANTPHLPSPLFKKEGRGIKEKVCLYMLSIAEKICVVANKIKPLEYFFLFFEKIFQGFFYCHAEMFLLSISSAYFLPCHLVAGEK